MFLILRRDDDVPSWSRGRKLASYVMIGCTMIKDARSREASPLNSLRCPFEPLAEKNAVHCDSPALIIMTR